VWVRGRGVGGGVRWRAGREGRVVVEKGLGGGGVEVGRRGGGVCRKGKGGEVGGGGRGVVGRMGEGAGCVGRGGRGECLGFVGKRVVRENRVRKGNRRWGGVCVREWEVRKWGKRFIW